MTNFDERFGGGGGLVPPTVLTPRVSRAIRGTGTDPAQTGAELLTGTVLSAAIATDTLTEVLNIVGPGRIHMLFTFTDQNSSGNTAMNHRQRVLIDGVEVTNINTVSTRNKAVNLVGTYSADDVSASGAVQNVDRALGVFNTSLVVEIATSDTGIVLHYDIST